MSLARTTAVAADVGPASAQRRWFELRGADPACSPEPRWECNHCRGLSKRLGIHFVIPPFLMDRCCRRRKSSLQFLENNVSKADESYPEF